MDSGLDEGVTDAVSFVQVSDDPRYVKAIAAWAAAMIRSGCEVRVEKDKTTGLIEGVAY